MKNALLWLVILVVIILAFNVFRGGAPGARELMFSDFLNDVQSGKVEEVTIRGHDIQGTLKAAGTVRPVDFKTYAPTYPDLVKDLRTANVKIKADEPKDSSFLVSLWTWLPFVVLIIFWIVIMRQMQMGGNKALSFGKSRARVMTPSQKKVTFKDVAGCEEAKVELQEIIEFLKEPTKFQKLGGKIPKGVLLMGSPGTGKTLLARAIAGEANVPFFSISGSDFVEMFVGVGASRVRDLFEQGKKSAPCIIFIDEIDAVGRHRGAGLGGGHDEREQTLNALLVEMDGFEGNEGVIIIAATNRPDVLDPALLRPGRFDRRVVVDRPDLKGREAILKVHTRQVPIAENVELMIIARGTPGFSGADLANLVNEAALNAARFDKKKVEMSDFEFAKDKVLMGPERKTMIMSDDEKRNTAYHEGGHALIAALLPDADPLHKVTIIPRGRALGLTMQLPSEDRYSYTKEYLEATITVMMGGRIAEETFIGHMTTGAGNDFEKATEMAHKMVCEWGMSDMGPLTFGKGEEEIFLGRDFSRRQTYSEATAIQIDAEVKKIVTAAFERGKKLIDSHQQVMHRIAKTLLEKETVEGEEILAIIAEVTGADIAKLRKTPPPTLRQPPPSPSPEPAPQPDKAPGGLIPEPA